MIIPDRAADSGASLGFAARSALRTYKKLLDAELFSSEERQLDQLLREQLLCVPEAEFAEYTRQAVELVRLKFPRR